MSGKGGKINSLIIVACLLALALSAMIAFWVFRSPDQAELTQTQERPSLIVEDQTSVSEEKARIKLYFLSPSTGNLEMEERLIPKQHSFADLAKIIIAELSVGSKKGFISPIPAGTTLRAAFIDEEGRVYLDFPSGPILNIGKAPESEIEFLSVILSAIRVNLPHVKEVQILVDGRNVGTLAGHIDISRPIPVDDFLKEVL
jgi:spore germination protein GerM